MDELEKLLEAAKGMVTSLRSKLDANDKLKTTLDRQQGELTGIKNSLDEFAASLASREVVVKRVEDIQALLTEAKQAKADAEHALSTLRGTEATVKQEIANDRAKLAIERQDVDGKRALQRKEYDQLNKDKAKIKEDRKNLKVDVMKEIGKKIGA